MGKVEVVKGSRAAAILWLRDHGYTLGTPAGTVGLNLDFSDYFGVTIFSNSFTMGGIFGWGRRRISIGYLNFWNDNWAFEAYGSNHIAELEGLAQKMATDLDVDIVVKLGRTEEGQALLPIELIP